MAMARFSALAALLALCACGTVSSVYDEPAPAPDEPPPFAIPPPNRVEQQAAPAPLPAPAPNVAAPGVNAPPAPAPPPRPSAGDEVIVPGTVERAVPAPEDPRSTAERMEDIHAWDTCVMRVQSRSDGDPMSAQLDSPEEVCRARLGMASRTAVPDSRR